MTEPIFHFDIVQGTEEWYAIRGGKVTASVVKTLLVSTGRQEEGFGVGAITEMYKVIEERITGIPRESFKSKGTDWGHEYESDAVEQYEMNHFKKCAPVGFVELGNLGCSPDSIVSMGDKIGLEAKCFPKEHMRILLTGIHGKNEYIQCQFNLWVTKFKRWDLIYYHPNLPEIEFLFTPDLTLFERFQDCTDRFDKLVESKIKELKL